MFCWDPYLVPTSSDSIPIPCFSSIIFNGHLIHPVGGFLFQIFKPDRYQGRGRRTAVNSVHPAIEQAVRPIDMMLLLYRVRTGSFKLGSPCRPFLPPSRSDAYVMNSNISPHQGPILSLSIQRPTEEKPEKKPAQPT